MSAAKSRAQHAVGGIDTRTVQSYVMEHMMRASDVMTSNVVSVLPETTIHDLARLLVRHRISAAPVVDEKGRVIGMISEGDLLRRQEIGTEKRADRGSWWLEMLGSDGGATDYIKSHALTVGEIMSREHV